MKTRYSGSDAPRGHRGCCPFARVGAKRNARVRNERCARNPEKGHRPL